MPDPLRLYTACPDSTAEPPAAFRERLRKLVGWCDEAGHEAILVRCGGRQLDPWTVAQLILQEDTSIRPIVTLHPLTMHPYEVVRRVVSLGRVYGRAPDLNLIASDSRIDRLALDDRLDASQRTRRLSEYASLIARLLTSRRPLRHHGEYYRLDQPVALRPAPGLPLPEFFVTGAGDPATAVAAAVDAVRVEPIGGDGSAGCLRLGMIARAEERDAWDAALARFSDRHGARLNERIEAALAGTAGEERARGRVAEAAESRRPLWLEPLETGHASSAYVVGGYRAATTELLRHMDAGVRRFLLEPPGDEEEMSHAGIVFERAWARHASPLTVAG